MAKEILKSVQSHQAGYCLEYLRKGGTLYVPSHEGTLILTSKMLKSVEKRGDWLLKESKDGGYYLRQGRGHVYLLPGQLCYSVAA